MNVNSYVVSGPTGAVVIDGQLTISDARKVRDRVRATGLPLAGVVVTHGHPDHYAGLRHMTDGADVPILAAAEVATVIRSDDAVKDTIVGPMMGDEWPSDRIFPNTLVEPGDSVTLGGVTLQMTDLGPAESRHDTLWHLDDTTAFVGDVAYNQTHAYLLDGNWDPWLAVLTRLEHDLPVDARLYVGHGEPGGIELLTRQRRYIETFVQAVGDTLDRTETARHDEVVSRMMQLVPTDELRFLMELSIEPAASQLRAGSAGG
jgi:glyoxylase-like metal-dependent hydrolase (beta-lactamase superfamily II)